MQPAVHATTRTPGPSTADPVVNECRNPISPLASEARTVVSVMSFPRSTRSSNGLFASSDGAGSALIAIALRAVERAVDHVHLLLAGQAHEVHRVARHTNRQARIFLRVLHRIHERV